MQSDHQSLTLDKMMGVIREVEESKPIILYQESGHLENEDDVFIVNVPRNTLPKNIKPSAFQPLNYAVVPTAYFACAVDDCAREVTYPASEIFWSQQENAWMCDNCLSYADSGPTGISLAEWLRQHSLAERTIE